MSNIDQNTSLYTSTLTDADEYNYCLECGNRMDEPEGFDLCVDCFDEQFND